MGGSDPISEKRNNNNNNNNIPTPMTRRPPSPRHLSSSSISSLSDHENEELQRLEHAPPFWRNTKGASKKKLSKQLSMCEIPRDMAWERRRRQILCQERRKNGINNHNNITNNNNNNKNSNAEGLTDEDMNELKGCIELGFGFNEEQGQRLCPTIPALDLYFAVNRQFATSPISSPNSNGSSASNASNLGAQSSSFGGGSPRSDSESWKICSPGDTPEHVKTKLRHWAQAVACSVRQSS